MLHKLILIVISQVNIENKLKTNGKTVIDSNLEEMDKYWEESKFNIK